MLCIVSLLKGGVLAHLSSHHFAFSNEKCCYRSEVSVFENQEKNRITLPDDSRTNFAQNVLFPLGQLRDGSKQPQKLIAVPKWGRFAMQCLRHIKVQCK